MSRQMTERETMWKDEAPPSTAMRNKKNIKRKKKLNTPKPSVFALISETRRVGAARYVPPSLSLCLSLSATGQSSFIFCPPPCEMLPLLRMSRHPLPTQLLDMALRLAAWLGAAAQRYWEWSWNTHLWLAGRERKAQLQPHLLTLLLFLLLLLQRESGRMGGREADRQRGGER